MNGQETDANVGAHGDTPPDGDTAASGGLDTDTLPVQLAFLAGEAEVALRELRQIGPGYVFDLERPVDRHIEVRANGRRIGVGELVEIDGRVGVRLLKCDQ